ncbi:uncharacterized protein V1516DRAFT_155907 [Lipomyces oligophaga]|uniref:uncharacterized protein n=1 Tax=Lipomyces oligophaga TaxID=45792 RepID=UPI0034CD29E6
MNLNPALTRCPAVGMMIISYIQALQENSVLLYASVFFALVGLIKYVSFGIRFTRLYFDLVLPGKSLTKYGAKKGAWALITGASDGIGKEYSFQLAKAGFNIFLVSRTESKLVALADEIKAKYAVETKYQAIDFATPTADDYSKLAATVSLIDVGVLINNVGQSHSIPVPFAEVDEVELTEIISINDLATLKVTRIVLPKMIAAKRGLILTMGSFGGYLPTPYLSVYSGSKAFLQQWSSALATEVKSQGVDVEFVLSYLVTSAMSKIKRTSLMIPNPKSFVKSTLTSIGLARGAQLVSYTSTPYPTHALFQFVIDNTVGAWSSVVARSNLNMHISIRKRALRKAERERKAL